MGSPGKTLSLELPFWFDSAARARSVLRSWLGPFVVDDDHVESAALVLTELVSNAVRHARPGANHMVRVELTVVWDMLHIAVGDGGSEYSTPQVLAETLTSTSGRGLLLVERLAEDWWSDVAESGRMVHATMLLNAHGEET